MSEESHSGPGLLVPAHQGAREYPRELPLLIGEDQVVFPHSMLPVRLTEERDKQLVQAVVEGPRLLAIVAQREESEEPGGLETCYEVGCICRVMQVQQVPDGSVSVMIQSLARFRIMGLVQRDPYLIVRVRPLEPPTADKEDLAALITTIKNQMVRLIALSPNVPDQATAMVESIEDPGFLADLVATNINISIGEKQGLLETLDPQKRLERLALLLAQQLEILELSEKIQSDVKSSIDESQREYFLRQQMKAIQDELSGGEGARPELAEYRERIEALELPAEVHKEAVRELDRLEKMNEASAEYHVITTYLDWIIELPWNTFTEDRIDLDDAEQILNEDHYGLDKVKKRILEYLAVRKLKPTARGPILCFVGPPGVGKTSLGKSIARTLGRNFTRMSLGGVRDEAEIRGHRKTYVGALPGRVMQSMRKVGSKNPVFMLDEVDKLGSDFRGDPSSALLEVLDPAQNDTFADHYLNVPFDLSHVMFIATANLLDTIPWALRDRMEVIEIPGYTVEEKLQIAAKYLVPRQLDANGLTTKKLRIGKPALRRIITEYTQEAGVRNLEREIGSVCRGVAASFARGRRKLVSIGKDDVAAYLGNPKVQPDVVERTRMAGVATGLAWTAVGGGILFIEATRMPGKGELVLTGQLGDVMKESGRAVMSYVRANADALGIPQETFERSDIHIHIPAGAVPKDGPSAGVTMLTALVSVLTNRKVKNRLAMTGEVTLRGLVLPVGGIKEKVLAAVRAGVREIILPERCKNMLDDVPESAKKNVKFHFVSEMSEVLGIALELKLHNPTDKKR